MRLLRAMVPALSAALRAPARLVGRGRALHATAARGAGSGGLFEDATALVGNTPVVKISDKLAPPGVEVYAKCEYFNPLSSVKVGGRRVGSGRASMVWLAGGRG